MNPRSGRPRRICPVKPRMSGSAGHAFVLVLLPGRGDGPPTPEDEYSLTDKFYACCETPACDCPIDHGNRLWKAETILPGGEFDGRVTGRGRLQESGADYFASDWENNMARPMEMAQPCSAFAIITPDGLWHECLQPEPQDFIPADEAASRIVELNPEGLTPFQVAWRSSWAESWRAINTAGSSVVTRL